MKERLRIKSTPWRLHVVNAYDVRWKNKYSSPGAQLEVLAARGELGKYQMSNCTSS